VNNPKNRFLTGAALLITFETIPIPVFQSACGIELTHAGIGSMGGRRLRTFLNPLRAGVKQLPTGEGPGRSLR
jgi:hypothetical protein